MRITPASDFMMIDEVQTLRVRNVQRSEISAIGVGPSGARCWTCTMGPNGDGRERPWHRAEGRGDGFGHLARTAHDHSQRARAGRARV